MTHPITGEKIILRLESDTAHHILFPEKIRRFKGGKMIEEIYGWHHDYIGHLEKTGKISFVKQTPGPYKTYFVEGFIIDGKAFDSKKSFFPKIMSQQTIINNIWDALKNPKKINVFPNGDLRIEGIGKSNIEIVCFLNKEGNITTAYPVIEKV